jgi:hypothetical protein
MWTAYDLSGRPLTTLSRGFTARQFTANATYTTPTGCKAIIVEAVGGGGAGGGSATATAANVSVSGGGSAGAYGQCYIASPNATYVMVVGLAGSGAAAANGNPGSNTSFGATVLLCQGGLGGIGGMVNSLAFAIITGGAVAPIATTTAQGLILKGGSSGADGIRTSLNTAFCGGDGADCPMGTGGLGPASVTTTNGGAALGFGAGGGGSVANTAASATGGAGAPGVIVVYEFY